MIIDGFIFFNEFDILESRLTYLENIVDYFILVESNFSHSGKPKPYYFLEQQDRFLKFKNKIIYYPFVFDQSKYTFDFTVKVNFNDYATPYWFLENKHRNCISDAALKFFKNDDVLLISDVDEIPNINSINSFKESDMNCAALSQKMFYYNLENSKPYNWIGSVITKVELLHTNSAQWFRNNRYDRQFMSEIPDGGWHCSYFGGVDKIIQKIENFAHQEFNNDYFKSQEKINEYIDQSRDIFGRPNEDLIKYFNISDFPEDFLNSFSKFIPKTN